MRRDPSANRRKVSLLKTVFYSGGLSLIEQMLQS